MPDVDTSSTDRDQLLAALEQQYGTASHNVGHWRQRARFLRKKYAWVLVVGGARALKRLIDILAAVMLLIGLSPLFLAVALAVKRTDGGPVF
jgi:lipopolysaccharide/colanic/teichoic acid biosynthesis glycosyltransferase